MNNFWPSLILIVNCIFSQVLSQNLIRKYHDENLSLPDTKETNFNILKTLVNIVYSWSQYERTCGTELNAKIDFLNEKTIINMMAQEIDDTSTSLSEATRVMNEPLKLFLETKNKLSPNTLNYCFSLEGDMFREWISTQLNKDYKLEQQDPICHSLENSFVLLELYKFVDNDSKKDGADENFNKFTIQLSKMIEMYEKSKISTIENKNFYFGQVQNFSRDVTQLFYSSLHFTKLRNNIINIFNYIYDDNYKITPYTEPIQSKPSSSTTERMPSSSTTTERKSSSSTTEREDREIMRTTDKSTTASTTSSTTTKESTTASTTTTTTIEESSNGGNDLVIKVEDYDDDKDEESLQDKIFPEDRELLLHFEIVSKFLETILDQYECSKMPEDEETKVEESNISPLLKLLLLSVQRNVHFRQQISLSSLTDSIENITEKMTNFMPQECGPQRIKNNETILALLTIINEYRNNFPTTHDSDQYTECYAASLNQLFSLSGIVSSLNFESPQPFRKSFNDELFMGANFEIQKCQQLKSPRRIGVALNIVYSKGT